MGRIRIIVQTSAKSGDDTAEPKGVGGQLWRSLGSCPSVDPQNWGMGGAGSSPAKDEGPPHSGLGSLCVGSLGVQIPQVPSRGEAARQVTPASSSLLQTPPTAHPTQYPRVPCFPQRKHVRKLHISRVIKLTLDTLVILG